MDVWMIVLLIGNDLHGGDKLMTVYGKSCGAG